MSATQIIIRRDTRENWTSVNPILSLAEVGIITDSSPTSIKIGDGTSTWNQLSEIVLGSVAASANIAVANPETVPDNNTVYLASVPSQYTNFITDALNPISISPGQVCLLTSNGGSRWEKYVVVNILNYLGIYNLNNTYGSSALARADVPSILQIPGIIITYKIGNTVYTEQFIGTTWSTADGSWREFGNSTSVVWQPIS